MSIFDILLRFIALPVGGALMALAHPFRYEDLEINPSWKTFIIATVGLLLFIPSTLRSESGLKRFLWGIWGGLSFFSVTIFWIDYALEVYGELPSFVSIPAMLLLAGYCSLFLGAWAYFAGSIWIKEKGPLAKIFCWASLWTFLEAIRQWLFTGFGWGEIGFGLGFSPWIAKTAWLWGVHGLTFLWIFFAGSLLHIFEIVEDRQTRKNFLLVFGLFLSLGFWSSWEASKEIPTQKIKIGMIQPNIAQDIKWDPQKAEEHLELLLKMSQAAVFRQADIIIWPETAFPFPILGKQRQLPFTSPKPLIFGAVVKEGRTNRNSAILMKDETARGRFDKSHLVPFGEYVPLKDYIPFGKLVANAGDFLPGASDQALLKVDELNLNIGPLICYEDIFSRSSVALARKNAQLLVNLTNDAWYGPTSALSQHAAMAELQVYQTGIPMVRVTNNGLSSVIERGARRDFKTFERDIFVEEVSVPIEPKPSFFVLSYPLMEWIWIIIFAIAFAWKSKGQTKRIFFQKSNRY